MGYKIRQAQVNKVPYTLVVGDNEKAEETVTVRKYGEEQTQAMSQADFMAMLSRDIESYSRKEN